MNLGQFIATEGDERVYIFPHIQFTTLYLHRLKAIACPWDGSLSHVGYVNRHKRWHFFKDKRRQPYPNVMDEPYVYGATCSWIYENIAPIKIKVF